MLLRPSRVKKICPWCGTLFESYTSQHRLTDRMSCGQHMARLKSFNRDEYERRKQCARNIRELMVEYGYVKPLEEEEW